MKTQSMLAAFVVVLVTAWTQLGGVAQAQHEPMLQAVDSPVAATTHAHHDVSHVVLDPHGPRLNGARILGWFLVPIGGLGIVGGVVGALAGALVQHPLCIESDGGCPGRDASGYWALAGASAGVGLLALLTGIALVTSNPAWDEANVPNVQVAIAPTEGGATASLTMRF